MTRKLHNTLMAAIASSSMLVVGVIISSPLSHASGPDETARVFASIDAEQALANDAIEQVVIAPIQPVRKARNRRPSLAMPFFSFAPRG